MSVDLSGNDGALIGNQNFKAMRMESQGRLFIAYAVVNASRMGCFPVLGRWLVLDHLSQCLLLWYAQAPSAALIQNVAF
jgi:hypothetical protein